MYGEGFNARRTRYTSEGVRRVRTVARLERTAWMMLKTMAPEPDDELISARTRAALAAAKLVGKLAALPGQERDELEVERGRRQPDRQARYLPLNHPLGVVNSLRPADLFQPRDEKGACTRHEMQNNNRI